MSLEDLIITDRRLGEGGFGSVFVCKLDGKEVAAKKLSQSEKKLSNLIREAARLKRLRHGKHIAYTYGITSKGGSLYTVMEYSEHGDLQNYLKNNKQSVTYEQKMLFCRGILLGLLYCHSMNVFHGDIKCSNVILGKNMEPKLTDFGLSVTVDNIEDYCKTYEGSIHWTAPELFSMEEESSFEEFKANPYPSDVYSLGATFCEVSFDGTTEFIDNDAIFCKVSFDGTTGFIDSDDPVTDIMLGNVHPTPKDAFLEAIIDKCCQFERNERISLDECLSMLDTAAEEQLLIPTTGGEQQDAKTNSEPGIPPSFILRRPAENLVVGPSNLSLLEWLCINDYTKAVKHIVQLRKPGRKQLRWLYSISVFCKSPNTVDFLQNMLHDNLTMPLKLLDLIDTSPWQLIEAFIEARANFDEKGLLEKAIERHYNKVVQLLANSTSYYSTTIIHYAIKCGNAEAAGIFADRISLECRDRNGDTPLLAAINAENVEIVKILLDNNADVHNKNDRSRHILRVGGQHTPLHRAAVKGNYEIVELLISAGATIDTEGSEWYSLVQNLERQGKSAVIQLISNAMRKRAKAAEGNHSAVTPASNNEEKAETTPLCTAIQNGQFDLVQKLIDDGADVNEHDCDKYLPLHWAIIIGDEEIVRILLKAGAGIDAKTPNEEQNFYDSSSLSYFNGYTPLHIAIIKRHFGIARLLIESGADFSLKNTAGQTVMGMANDNDKSRIESIIHEYVPVTEDSFQWVLRTMGPETVKVLISSKSASMNTLNHFLCIAACHGNTEAINYLLEYRVNVNSKYEGKSPLEWAIFGGHTLIVQILIGHGAGIRGRENTKRNARSLLAILRGCSIRNKDEASEVQGLFDTLLHQAAASNNVEIVEILLNAGIEINARDSDGYSALYYSALCGCDEVVTLLYEKGAKVRLWEKEDDSDAIYKTAKSIVHKAAETGKVNIEKIFTDAGVRVDFESESSSAPSRTVMLGKGEMTAESSLSNSALFSVNLDNITTLTRAVKGNQLERVQLLLDTGADVNAKSTNSRTPLFECVDESLVDMVHLLIEKGADVDARTERGYAPIHYVKERKIAEILISHGADINAKSIYGRTPLFGCVNKSLVDMVQFLIEKGADINARDERGYVSIHFVKDREITRILISHGADINTRNIDGRTPLIECVDKSLIDMVQFLIEKRADVNARTERGYAPIHFIKDREIAEILISHGADVNAKSVYGRTPLFEGVRKSLVDMVQFLLEKGIDVNTRDKGGYVPIHFVRDRKIAQILISHGADINTRNIDGRTPLIECVDKSLVDMVRFLIEKGADVNARTERGYAPIHFIKDREIAEILISHGTNINARSINGRTPLFECVNESLVDMVKFLIEKGGGICARDKDGFAPIHYVKKREIAEIIFSHGANINAGSTCGSTLLMECVDKSLVDMVRFLIEKGADVNARTKDDYAPIHFVKDRETAQILISHGADINTRSIDGRTPLIECVDKSLIDMVQFLIEKGADVNARTERGYAPIYFAKDREIAEILISHGVSVSTKSIFDRTFLFECVDNSLIDMVQFLIEKGADVNARDWQNSAPIHYAKDREIAEILISHGADVNARGKDDRTPLFDCVDKSLVDMVQFLLVKGADANTGDEEGYTPIHTVQERKIAEILISYSADINARSKNGRTPLIECVDKSLIDMVQFLLEKGADVDTRTEHGYAPIHYVKKKEIAEILISYGADINARSISGRTPLFECVDKSLVNTVQFLLDKGADVNARTEDGCAPIHYAKIKKITQILISHGADVNIANNNERETFNAFPKEKNAKNNILECNARMFHKTARP